MWKTILFSLLVFCSCRQQTETCTYPVIKVPCGIVFTGFDSTVLDTIIVRSYTPGNTFLNIVSADTLINTPVFIDGGTLYDSVEGGSFGSFGAGDMEVYLPSVNKTFQIHAYYSNDSTVSVSGVEGCISRTFTMPPIAVINGVTTQPAFDDGYYISLGL